MFARYLLSISIGGGVTLGLLFCMHLLVATGHAARSGAARFPLGEFVRVERPVPVDTKRRKPDELPPPVEPPPVTRLDETTAYRTTLGVTIPGPVDRPALGRGGIRFPQSDGDQLPIVKVTPRYPARALAQGIEGHVIVEFTVTRSGTVENVAVVESTHAIFDRAAIDAALKFKYKPRVIDGQAVDVVGVRNKISFEIAD